ncbi:MULTISPECIES: BON domain-containing protein [Rhodomicrobium]|uniref:BON domain-containing protein n=1 Tax=Rhodomicrobium TaxID=1068 RepID=UPI000B4A8624|nr:MULTISPECIES: BON domain-containing protein [Rhodomicrobium]
MRSDEEIRRDVEDELKWTPTVGDADIAVSVKNGIVMLTGFVPDFTSRFEAEAAAKRVAGVIGIANDIEVRLPAIDERPDPAIARDAVAALALQLPSSWEQIKVVVKSGVVTLDGEVEWDFQRKIAEETVGRIRGVREIRNLIRVNPRVSPEAIKQKIKQAFLRSAELDAENIRVEVEGHRVVLEGTVRSWAEREAAERTAWAGPGIALVENHIAVKV